VLTPDLLRLPPAPYHPILAPCPPLFPLSQVPIIYSMNRRQLSKAVGANTRQSVAGIISAEGCFPTFKKLQRWYEGGVGDLAMQQVQQVLLEREGEGEKDGGAGVKVTSHR